MSAFRSKKKNNYTNISRNALSQQNIAAIDSFLKSLRKLLKNATNIQNTHTTELHLIQQIYYKSRNQHGIALFWRNLTEVRRYAGSIEVNSLSALINYIRSSFYSSDEGNPITWKNTPWRQAPERRFLEDVLVQIQKIHALYSKAAEGYRKAYISFSRFSHSTSFLPLSVTLLGMAARFYVLALDIDNESTLLWQEIHKLLHSIEQSHQICNCKPPKSISTLEPLEDPVTHSHDIQMLENNQADMGEIISRSEIHPAMVEGIIQESVIPPNNVADVMEAEDDVVPHITITHPNRPSQVTSQATTSRSPKKDTKRKSQKSKTSPRDEIDLIFG